MPCAGKRKEQGNGIDLFGAAVSVVYFRDFVDGICLSITAFGIVSNTQF